MSTKACRGCGQVKPLTGFYRHARMADGHLHFCKECHCASVRRHRQANIERVRAYDKVRNATPERAAARAEYQATPAYARSHQAACRRYNDAHPERYAARYMLTNAIRDGKVEPWPVCALPDCSAKPEAHHPDYDRPLDVVWLCSPHHKQAHATVKF